jgi:hypothetical protein
MCFAETRMKIFSNGTSAGLSALILGLTLGSLVCPTVAYSLSLQTGVSSALFDSQDGTREKSWDFMVSQGFAIGKTYRIGAKLTGSTDINQRDGSDFGSGVLSLSHEAFKLNAGKSSQTWDFAPRVGLSLPVSKDARDNQSFLYGIKPGLSISPSSELLGSKRLELSFDLAFTRNSHTYELAKDGSANAQYSSAQGVTLGYILPKKFHLEFSLNHFNSWSYAGNSKESYSHGQELGYEPQKNVALSVGHSYGNPAVNIYAADGQSSNFGLVNDKYSYVYANINVSY